MLLNKLRKFLKFLKPAQLAALDELLSAGPDAAQIMPHELAHRLSIPLAMALVVLSLLGEHGITDNQLLIYHSCTRVVVAATPSGRGFPLVPWTCPNCGKSVKHLESLRFAQMAIVCRPKRRKSSGGK